MNLIGAAYQVKRSRDAGTLCGPDNGGQPWLHTPARRFEGQACGWFSLSWAPETAFSRWPSLSVGSTRSTRPAHCYAL